MHYGFVLVCCYAAVVVVFQNFELEQDYKNWFWTLELFTKMVGFFYLYLLEPIGFVEMGYELLLTVYS